ncbi:MAG: prepilin-type N-terminal cleavage/methylation domain-containing protein [bacterium]
MRTQKTECGSKRPGSGFTLIELIIVIVIVGILAGIAIPTYANYQARLTLQTALSQVESDLRNIQTKAKATGVNYQATFPTDTSTYWLNGVPKGLPAGVTITNSSIITITYYPAYSPYESTSTGTVYFDSRNRSDGELGVNSMGMISSKIY